MCVWHSNWGTRDPKDFFKSQLITEKNVCKSLPYAFFYWSTYHYLVHIFILVTNNISRKEKCLFCFILFFVIRVLSKWTWLARAYFFRKNFNVQNSKIKSYMETLSLIPMPMHLIKLAFAFSQFYQTKDRNFFTFLTFFF